jgi:hypothetical protein
MSDMTSDDPREPGSAATPPPPASAVAPAPVAGWGPPGQIRGWGTVAILWIITCSIYGIFWQYYVFRDNKEHSGEGIGGGVALVFALLAGVANLFLLPSEIGNIYAKAGQEKPVTVKTGFWVLIPIVGFFIWLHKVQTAINTRWEQMGVSPA